MVFLLKNLADFLSEIALTIHHLVYLKELVGLIYFCTYNSSPDVHFPNLIISELCRSRLVVSHKHIMRVKNFSCKQRFIAKYYTQFLNEACQQETEIDKFTIKEVKQIIRIEPDHKKSPESNNW